MANPQITAYLRTYSAQGFTHIQLKQALIQQGWPAGEVEAAIHSLNLTEEKVKPEYKMKAPRPRLITLIGGLGAFVSVLLIIMGVVGFFMALIAKTILVTVLEDLLSAITSAGISVGAINLTGIGFLILLLPLLIIAGGIFSWIVSIKLLKLKKFGWIFYFGNYVIALISKIIGMFTGSGSFMGLIMPVFFIWYFWKKRALFGFSS